MPHKIRDLVLAALGVVLVVGGLALMDRRVPDEIVGMAGHVSSGQWHAPGSVVSTLFATASASPIASDVFLFSMVAAGVVLFVLMLRT